MRFDAVIFDLDGTLIDSLEDMWDSVNRVLAVNGYPLRELDEIRRFIGNGAKKLIERSLPAGTSAQEVRRVLDIYREEYQRHLLVKTHPYSGIPELLKSLKKAGMKLAVLSNKPHDATTAICEDLFPGILDLSWGDRPGVPRKPDPTALLMAMETLGVKSSRVAYVGDSETDIRTAKNAGLYAVGVAWGFRGRAVLEAEQADSVCETAEELKLLLKSE